MSYDGVAAMIVVHAWATENLGAEALVSWKIGHALRCALGVEWVFS